MLKVAVTFGDGLVETSESFFVVYQNQFGVVCFAWQDARAVAEVVPPPAKVQEDWSGGPTVGDWPDGSGAGAYTDDDADP
jgi:hypothetical protein